MQLLESSVIGLRAARHHLTSRTSPVSVTLFPMCHLGTPEFYQTVYDDAGTHDIVLLEGIASRAVRSLTRAYRWARPERLGLVVQKHPTFPETCQVIHSDLTGPEFEALWATVPRWERWTIAMATSLFGLWMRYFSTLDVIAPHLSVNDVPPRDQILGPDPLVHILLNARDERLCEHLTRIVQNANDRPLSVAVIYGASHMPAVIRHLGALANFTPTESEWMTVFGY